MNCVPVLSNLFSVPTLALSKSGCGSRRYISPTLSLFTQAPVPEHRSLKVRYVAAMSVKAAVYSRYVALSLARNDSARINDIVIMLTGSGVGVTAATVAQAKRHSRSVLFARFGNGFTYHHRSILFMKAPRHMDVDSACGQRAYTMNRFRYDYVQRDVNQ